MKATGTVEKVEWVRGELPRVTIVVTTRAFESLQPGQKVEIDRPYDPAFDGD